MRILLFILFTVYSTVLFSQEKFLIKGIVFHEENKQRQEAVIIKNLNTKESNISDAWGTFSISASIGDTLVFSKENFREVIKPINTKQNLVLYLRPNIVLEEVIVKGQTRASEQKEILEAFKAKGIFFNGKPPLLFSLFHPLAAIHELISKDGNNAQRFVNYVSRENSQAAVDKKFNPTLIKAHVNIDDKDIAEFIYYYRPLPEKIASWNDYDTIKYIKDSYQNYLKKHKN